VFQFQNAFSIFGFKLDKNYAEVVDFYHLRNKLWSGLILKIAANP